MRSIVYGVVDARRAVDEPLPAGWNGADIIAVQHGGLAALLSPFAEEPGGSADVERALAFARVVSRLHRRMAIVPMRFGSLVRREEEAAEFLRQHEGELADALAEVEGCDEMGLRILIRDPEAAAAETVPEPPLPQGHAGVAYLERRRRFYERQERAERVCDVRAERAEAAFSGLFRQVRREHVPCPEGRLLSLSFLVERPRVDAFIEACRVFRQESSWEAICSGPWPPYSFVPALAKTTPAAQL